MGERAGRFFATFGAPHIDELEDGVVELFIGHEVIAPAVGMPVLLGACNAFCLVEICHESLAKLDIQHHIILFIQLPVGILEVI